MEQNRPTSRELIAALLRLNNISQGKAADRAGLVRQNVSSWYTGRENGLSQDNLLRFLATLGVSYGTLRMDGIHQWTVREVEDAALVLRAVLDEQERATAQIWQVHNARYPGCIILKVTSAAGPIYVVMHRPLLTTRPQPLTAESLRCGVEMGEIEIDNATWESWLPPAVLAPETFIAQLTHLIEKFPYPMPPPAFYDDLYFPDGENLNEASQQEVMVQLAPSPDELKKWNEILLQAKLTGKDFGIIARITEQALGIRVLGRSHNTK